MKQEICVECIVKRRGGVEEFDERKVYASCYAACLSAHIDHVKAEKICEKVAIDLKKWLGKKKTVTSDQIFRETTRCIRKYSKEAAFMYETHRDIG